jgi:hypothetical protein
MTEDLIKDVYDEERGCGFREEGGLYLKLDDFIMRRCGRALVPIVPCECCGLRLKQSRGFQWFNPQKIIASVLQVEVLELLDDVTVLDKCGDNFCGRCFFGMATPQRAGLIISRRIPAVPKGFKTGEDVVYLAHPNAFDDQPAIFLGFKPSAIEYVVKGDEEEEELLEMIEKGITPVRVHSSKYDEYADMDEPDIDDDFPMSLEYDDDRPEDYTNWERDNM